MSYQIIETNREMGGVETLSGALGVSVSGYDAWRSRPSSLHQQTDAVLLKAIRRVYQAGRGLYGSPRIHAALRHLIKRSVLHNFLLVYPEEMCMWVRVDYHAPP